MTYTINDIRGGKMVNYKRAVMRPFTDFKKLIIGLILNIIPIINFFASGYQMMCAKTALKKHYRLPEWRNWGDLFIKGLIMFIIGIIYLVPAIIVGFAVGGVALISSMIGVTGSYSVVDVGAGAIVTMILFILAIYLLPVALLSYINKEDFSAAFRLREVFRKAFRNDYLIAWFIMFIYTLILTVILGMIPRVGATFAQFIGGVTSLTVFAEIYHEL